MPGWAGCSLHGQAGWSACPLLPLALLWGTVARSCSDHLKPQCSSSQSVANSAWLVKQPLWWVTSWERAADQLGWKLQSGCHRFQGLRQQMLVHALSCTSSFPKGLFWVLIKWLSCVIAYEMAISAINILQQKPIKFLCWRVRAQSSQWTHMKTWPFQTFLRITELYNWRYNKNRNKADLYPTP